MLLCHPLLYWLFPDPAVRFISVLYFPVNAAFLCFRRCMHYGGGRSIHQQLEWTWTVLIVLSTAVQRVGIARGWQPVLAEPEIIALYHCHWGMA